MSITLLSLVVGGLLIVILAILFILKKRTKKGVDSEYINEQVYVGNLPYSVNEDHLRDYFGRFGAIQSVRVIRNFKTGRSKGYAFVTYFSTEHADAALVAHGSDLGGRSIVVRIAKPRQDEQSDD